MSVKNELHEKLKHANKNEELVKEANKHAEEKKLKEDAERAENLAQNFHRQNSHKFALEQIKKQEYAASSTRLKNEIDPQWRTVVERAKGLYMGEQAGYDTFISASAHQVKFISEFSPVAAKKINVYFADFLESLKALTSTDPKDFQAKTISFTLEFNHNNELVINTIAREDGQALTQDQVMAFQSGVVAWLMNNNYTPSQDEPGKFEDEHGAPLTDAKFKALGSEYNLTAFFADMVKKANQSEPAKAAAAAKDIEEKREAAVAKDNEAAEAKKAADAKKAEEATAARAAEEEENPSATRRPPRPM